MRLAAFVLAVWLAGAAVAVCSHRWVAAAGCSPAAAYPGCLPPPPTPPSPSLPASLQVWLVDLLGGHPLVGICDASGEDAMCHSAVCHLGLCSSISDHLLYLSEMYSPHPEGC